MVKFYKMKMSYKHTVKLCLLYISMMRQEERYVHCWEKRQSSMNRNKKLILTIKRTETKRDQNGFWNSCVTMRCPKDMSPKSK